MDGLIVRWFWRIRCGGGGECQICASSGGGAGFGSVSGDALRFGSANAAECIDSLDFVLQAGTSNLYGNFQPPRWPRL